MDPRSVVEHIFFARARETPDGAAYYHQVEGTWRAVEWRDYALAIQSATRALHALGVVPGARVAIVSDNRPEWAVLHLAALAAGALSVGIYPNQPMDALCQHLAATEAVLALVDRPAHARELIERAAKLPALGHVVTVGSAAASTAVGALTWSDFLAAGERPGTNTTTERTGPVAGPAVIAMTPGTTGPGKAVVLTHENLLATAGALIEALAIGADDWTLSYLPLAHPLEQALSVHVPALVGSLVYYAEAPDKVARNLRQVQPSVFTATPRIWRAMHETVAVNLDQLTGWQRALLGRARRVATRVQAAEARGQRPGLGVRTRYGLARYLFIDKLKGALGLKNARVCLSAGDHLAPDTHAFFASLSITIRELYGQVETGYPISVARDGAVRAGAVGTPVADIRIAENGELAVRGAGVCAGYLADEGERAFVDADGWWWTGDLCRVDRDGFLWVIGRADEVFTDSSGRVLGARAVEHALVADPAIADAVAVVGDGGAIQVFLTASGVDDPAIDDVLARVAEGAPELPPIAAHTLLDRELTVEGGELTPMFTVKRAALARRYRQKPAG